MKKSKKCIHKLVEKETALADGLCPICLQQELIKVRKLLKQFRRKIK